MAFTQYTLDRSFNQTRGIFDKYVYKTSDTMVTVQASGYFSAARFTEDWEGGIIECLCSDGFFSGLIGTDMEVTPLAVPSRVSVLRSSSTVNQNPTATDTYLQVNYGDAVNTAGDPVHSDALGNIYINQADTYHFRISSQYGRNGSGGTAWLWQRALIDGSQVGRSILGKINNANSDFPFQSEFTLTLDVGQIFTIEMWRDSIGANDGGYIYQEPTLGTANPGFSADIIVSRYINKF